MKSFLRGLLGLGAEANGSPKPRRAKPPAVPKTPKPPSQAYLNRKKGRPAHPDRLGYMKPIIEHLVLKGEASPGEMAKELGLPKSTLVYNLNRLIALCQLSGRWGEYLADHVVKKLFEGRRVVRVGGGKHVRYRLEEVPQQGQESPGPH